MGDQVAKPAEPVPISVQLAGEPRFVERVNQKATTTQLVEEFKVGETTVNHARKVVRLLQKLEKSGEPEKTLTAFQQHRQELIAATVVPPTDQVPLPERERELELEVAKLRQQLAWAQHANPAARTGGKVTINHSDDHFGDRAHMLDCWKELWEKTLLLLDIYQPEEILMLSNGDKVAGRGIYKEQNMDCVLPMTTQQTDLGAWKVYRCDQDLKQKFPGVPVRWHFTHGNHDINMGERITPALVYRLRSLGVDCTYHGDEAILNLAHQGEYWVLAEHGTGYSDLSPSSPKYLANLKDKILGLALEYYGVKRLRRALHGHTHWASLGMERWRDFKVDTTGGCQRNERVLLGKNQRPMGWIAYVSPNGYDDILDPILIQPEDATVTRELRDPYLFNRNLEDASAALRSYHELELERGIRSGGPVPEGR